MTSQRTRDRLIERLRRRGITSQVVLRAMANVPRHLFVEEALASRAYEEDALPIGRDQTISQPYVVAWMTESLLAVDHPVKKVLEIGTGSGYQAAVLSEVVDEVFSVERIGELARQARRRFRQLGYRNVRVKQEDGFLGWPSEGPYDGIIITAAPDRLPIALAEQLVVGGRMIVPVGPRSATQQLISAIKLEDGTLAPETLGDVVFVPMLDGME